MKNSIHCVYNYTGEKFLPKRIWQKAIPPLIFIILLFGLFNNVQASTQSADPDDIIGPQLKETKSPILISADNRRLTVNGVEVEICNDSVKFTVDDSGIVHLLDATTNNRLHELKIYPDTVYELMAPYLTIHSIQLNTTGTTSYYEVKGKKDFSVFDGYVKVELIQNVDAETGKSTLAQKRIMKNNELIYENKNELLVIDNHQLKKLSVDKPEIKSEKLLVSYIDPLVSIEKIENSDSAGRFVVQVKKNSNLSFVKRLLSSKDYDFVVIEDNLLRLIEDEVVLKVCDEDNAIKFVNYAKEILKVETESDIRRLRLKETMLDVVEIPQLKVYMDNDGWDVKPGQISPYQQFVTPDEPAIQQRTTGLSNEEIYDLAKEVVWVSDSVLHGSAEKWLMPKQLLLDTPTMPNNPLPGTVVSDCSEQAHYLVSMLRASDVPPEDVRVVLGKVNFGEEIGGHAWVEIKENGKWMVLEPTSGPYYDEESETLITRGGMSYDYWKYHPYPVVEVWCYYNDVYFTDEGEEVASGWSNTYDAEESTEASILAGFISKAQPQNMFVYVAIAAVAIIVLLIVIQFKRKGPRKK